MLALTAAISIGATLAYLTDTDEDVNVMTLGKVKIDQLEYERINVESKDADAEVQEFHDNKPLIPAVTDKDFNYTPGASYVDWEQIGKEDYTSPIWDPTKINNEVDKMVFVKNKGDYDAYVRSVFAFEAGKYTTLDEFRAMVHLNLNETEWTWDWAKTPVTIGESTYFVATATYNKVLAPGALTEISLSQIALDKTATNADVEAFGETYQVLVKSQGIQADGFTDPDTALNEGFGEITATENIPWDNDAATKGVTMKNALHYLNGDTTGTKITSKVTNVVFGLTKEHTDIVNNNKGVLMDVEQDVPVYAYYVPNGSNYDIYLLSDDTIYTPKDSSSLFDGMGALTSVDTSNLDFSRTENMDRMFFNCKKLANLDTSDWDLSNAEIISGMFYSCRSLQTLDVSKWDVSNVTNMYCTFGGCEKVAALDVSKWDVSNVTNMGYTFWHAYALEELDVANWDVGNVTNFQDTFAGSQNAGDMSLKKLEVENWDVSSATTLRDMFYSCGDLVGLDLSKWDVRNVTTVSHMFADCFNLKEIDFSGWQTPNLVSMDGMFNDCRSMTTVDLSMFDTSKVKEFSQMFEACWNLENVIGLEKFDTSNGQDFSEMFSGCGSLKELNLSTFDTRQANSKYLNDGKYTNLMFKSFIGGCTKLEKITFGPYFSFDGDGSAPDTYKFVMPAATNVEGWDGNWYDAKSNAYAPSAIPEETAATYYAVKPVTP